MSFSMTKNVLSGAFIGALALLGMSGCAAESDFGAVDTAGTEDVASTEAELASQDYCYAPWVNQWNAQEYKYYANPQYPYQQQQYVYSGYWYSMQDTYNNQYLKYDYRNPGVDLYYYENGQYNYNMKYEKEYGGVIKYGDKVAWYFQGRGYLHYAPQQYGYGYELTYVNYPSYEWQIQGGQYGQYVKTNYKTSLYNVYKYDYAVYCQREYGIDMSWAGECHDSQYGRYYKDYCSF